MRFQERDGRILQAIHDYDGVLARRQLKKMFWPTATTRAMEKRLSKLYRSGYLDWPSREQRRTKPIPESIVWLAWQGAQYIAAQAGVYVRPPTTIGENQLRLLDRRLRKQGIRWMREPRWIQLQHDLAIVDFRLAVEKATVPLSYLSLDEWIPEGVFLADADLVEYQIKLSSGEAKQDNKRFRPDGYFVIVDQHRRIKGSPARARFLLELDRSTHPNPRFGREKAAPGVAYIKSPAYKKRFGFNSGRILVVTCGGLRRMTNLMRETHQAVGGGARSILFTTFAQAITENALTSPIWRQWGRDEPLALFAT